MADPASKIIDTLRNAVVALDGTAPQISAAADFQRAADASVWISPVSIQRQECVAAKTSVFKRVLTLLLTVKLNLGEDESGETAFGPVIDRLMAIEAAVMEFADFTSIAGFVELVRGDWEFLYDVRQAGAEGSLAGAQVEINVHFVR